MPGEFWLLIHLLWVIWMIAGVVLALVGFLRPSLWRMPIFRLTHLIGLLLTATVPIWNRGICPITQWESGEAQSGARESFLHRILWDLVYWDVPQYLLSILTAVAALVSVILYFARPPWQPSHRGGDSRWPL